MKKLALTFVMTLFLVACSSGTTVSDVPNNLTGNYTGTFENQEGSDKGTVSLDLVEDSDGNFSGIIRFIDSLCLISSPITSGTSVGFNLQLILTDLTMQLNSDNAGNLSGSYTYTSSVGTCSNPSGTGTINLSRS
jgi:hypothetical protein